MRPNILYLHSHDTGRYIQPYGHAIPTPVLQWFAEQGVLFRQAFCTAPMCSPSRASLLTGQMPHNCGMVGLAHRGFALNDYRQHLIHTLRAAGYFAGLIGVQHIAADAWSIGYDHVAVQHSGSPDADPDALDFLRDAPRADDIVRATSAFLHDPPDSPLFLSVGFFETHRPFPAADDHESRYCLPPAPLVDTPGARQDVAGFRASARLLDQSIGQILDTLDESGLAENTLVIYTADHGPPFPGMKCTLTDHGLGVALIMRGPGGFGGGQVFDAMVSHLDLFPTLCDMLEIAPPAWLQGQSLLPLLRGERERLHDALFGEINYHGAYEPQRSARTQRWKYIRRYGERRRPVMCNVEDSPGKEMWLEHGWAERELPAEELYDLVFDPNEAHNLADDDRFGATLSDLRHSLDDWMQATGDPLLFGPIQAPPGALANDPDSVSPAEPLIDVG